MEAFFILNIVKRFMTAYHDDKKVLITDGGRIAVRYLKNDLVIDVVVSFPFMFIQMLADVGQEKSDDGHLSSKTKLLRIMRILRIGQIVKVLNQVRMMMMMMMMMMMTMMMMMAMIKMMF